MNPVLKYFSAERLYCAIGIGIGMAAIFLAIYLLMRVRQPFFTGMAYPLLVVGLFFLLICTGVYFRSPKDIARVNEAISNNLSHIKSAELPRMENVMNNFRIIMRVEVTFILLSTVGLILLRLTPAWKGALTGLLVLSLLLLGFDWLAHKRGDEYHRYLKSITK